jgi:Helix-turn-helix domain
MPNRLSTAPRLRLAASENYDPRRSRTTSVAPYGVEGLVETTANILTIKEVADILRCSKTHAQNVIEGKVNGLPKLTHLSLGRRKVVRKEWLDQWMEANKTR